MNRIRTIVVIATVVAFIGVLMFVISHAWLESKLGGEVFKLTYQFLLIVVIGGAVSLLYKQLEIERVQRDKQLEIERAERDVERKLRGELHADVVRTYHAAKKIRRVLRARAIERSPNGKTVVLEVPYNEQMLALIDTQLDFESFVHRVRRNTLLFAGAPAIEGSLKRVESYLSAMVTEYESSRTLFKPNSGSPDLSLLPRLLDFIGPYEETSFKSGFKEPFFTAIAALEALNTRPRAQP